MKMEHISQIIEDRVHYLTKGRLLFSSIWETNHKIYNCFAGDSVAGRMWEV